MKGMNITEVVSFSSDFADRAGRDKLDSAKRNVQLLIDEKNGKGYKVLSVTPISTGDHFEDDSFGWGHSYTVGVLIVFEYFGGED